MTGNADNVYDGINGNGAGDDDTDGDREGDGGNGEHDYYMKQRDVRGNRTMKT